MTTKKKNQYYDIKPLLKLNAEYNMIMGERSNGKTYSVLNVMIEHFLKTGEYGVYIRRYADEILPSNIKGLFNPFEIEKLSKGKYNHIGYRGKQFDIGTYDYDKDKWIKKEPFCFCAALNTWESAKGPDRGIVGIILFDEFLTRRYYLTNEFLSFQNVLSSFVRDRGNAKVFMVGNTVSFYSPYFEEFGLENIKDMKVGDVACFTFENGTKIAVEYCESVGETKESAKFFNFNSTKANMITTGKWEIPDYPHYGKSIDFIREVIFRFYVYFDNEILCCCIVRKKEEVFLYIHMQTKDVDFDNELVFTTSPDGNPRHYTSFSSSTFAYAKVAQLINMLIRSDKMFFSTNKVGEIFNNYWKWQSRYSVLN
ncbi:MAG: phage DNA encapsidation protein [Methanobrevibacter sp.]|nr:phage DNA encapsidation protein [Methanobrevibacter sp.]